MSRYIGGSLAVAAASTVFTAVATSRLDAGAAPGEALATGLSRASLLVALTCVAGLALVLLMRLAAARAPQPGDRAFAAAAATHTIPRTSTTQS